MISKIGKAQEFRSVVNYILEQGKGTEILDSDGVMLYSPDSIIHTFNFQTELNPQLSKPVGHISLNFSVQDKKKLSNELMVQIAHDYMIRMGISETQYLIGRHYDKEHPHLHLIFNRVNNYGRTISDRFDHSRSEKICKELTIKYSLYFAQGKEKVNEHRLWEPDKTKYEIYNCLKSIIPQSQNWDQIICALQDENIGVAFNFKEKTDEIQGIIFNKNGYFFSGAKVHRQFSYFRIDHQLKLSGQK
ncbi:MAG: relaxase/mobilization nuclease domain-containing protein [Prolixibacteraceae bacterium]|nr:relaxase/mobilization nuclease domain-containing protein [Prolixibacteraceae bacterium]